MKGGAALGAFGLAAGVLPIRPALAAPLTIGIVYVGPRDDFGWNQAHAVAAEALKAIPDVTVVEEENVPGDRRGLEDDGEHDPARRRRA